MTPIPGPIDLDPYSGLPEPFEYSEYVPQSASPDPTTPLFNYKAYSKQIIWNEVRPGGEGNNDILSTSSGDILAIDQNLYQFLGTVNHLL